MSPFPRLKFIFVDMMQAKEQKVNQEVIRTTLTRIAGHKGVLGYMFLRPKDGVILDVVGFNNDKQLIDLYSSKLYNLISLAQSVVRTINHTEEVTFLRMRFGLREAIVAPDLNKEYILVVIQDQILAAEAEETPAVEVADAAPQ
jgi:dynein light chain roadblock-type